MTIALRAMSVLLLLTGSTLAQQEEPPQDETRESYDSKTAAAVQVKGDTRDWFEVLKGDGKRAHPNAPPLLNNTVEVPPGEYDVAVNKSTHKIKVEAGQKVVLLTGTLVVEGQKANFYAPFQGKERKVTGNPRKLNSPMALLPGTYRVELNVEVNKQVVLADGVKIAAGKKTALKE